MAAAKKTPADAAGVPGFEQALERLETIVTDMEGGRLSLDDMIARFEEGQALVRTCTRKLNEVEKRIEQLVKPGDEKDTVPFDPETAGGEERPASAAPRDLPF